MKSTLPRSLDERRRHAGGTLVPRVDRRAVGQLRARRPARAAGPRHRTLRPRRLPASSGRWPRRAGPRPGARHLGGDDRLGHGPAPSTSSSSATSAASCATSSRRSSRSRTTSMPPASSSSSPTSGCSPRTPAPGTSSSARPTRPRPTAGSSPSASARATPRSADGSGVPGGNRTPFGLIREGKPSVLRVDEEKAAIVVRAYQLAATGSTDWEVAAADRARQDPRRRGPHQPHLRRTAADRRGRGHRADRRPGALVDGPDDARATTDPDAGSDREGRLRPAPVLRRLREYLFGDVGRYRHPPPTCEAFLAATPDRTAALPTGHDTRIQGPLATRRTWYEDAVGELLGEGRRSTTRP